MRRKGFTLVELLVVIGIVAALIAMLLPALSLARESAKTIRCGANLRQIGIGVAMYENQNRFYLPPANGVAGPTDSAAWHCRVQYALTGKGQPTNLPASAPWDATQIPIGIFICPKSMYQNPDPNGAAVNYGWNPLLVPSGAESARGIYTFRVTSLKQTHRLILVGDRVGMKYPLGNRDTGYKLAPPLPFCTSTTAARQYPDPLDGSLATGLKSFDAIRNNHNGKTHAASFLYADGHVESKPPAFTWMAATASGMSGNEWER